MSEWLFRFAEPKDAEAFSKWVATLRQHQIHFSLDIFKETSHVEIQTYDD